MTSTKPPVVDRAKVESWPPRVRASVRSVLTRGITVTTSPALRAAVREITSLIDDVNGKAVGGGG